MPLCAMRVDMSSHATTIRRFLLSQQGYYCDVCLAGALGLSLAAVRREVWREDAAAFVIRYRACSGCAVEKEVIALNR